NDAIEVYRDILDDYPNTPTGQNCNFAIGTVYEQSSRPDSAIANYRRQWQNYPQALQTPDALLHGGDLMFSVDEYGPAI
ncbi:MAG: hypothetical protein GWO08_06730, partial [Gammaproteobacteria bacterium]|nr:hypothetical protein [Gammaproteobacteria bacterium]NIR93366.1 hypothetical protein [Gammaproteobacteria bacterium]NIW47989.1 hypothetical protein [Gammaproteobacteria bacterium]NIX57623.1 hypothetical protein [candidate division Zixibacteria bacterium]